MFDLVIRNGLVVDGTGSPRFRADVAVAGDRIACVGEPGLSGARVLDAEGCIVAPGFIDIHSHTDEMVFVNPTCESKVTQGVTTEFSGNCGDSAAPRIGCQNLDDYALYLAEHGIEFNWRTVGELLARLDDLPMTVNFATFVGHGTIRGAAVGYHDRPAKDGELAEMRRLLTQAMEEGAFGLSSGLVYPPGCFAPTEELVELCRVVARYGGIYATHMRNEGEHVLTAVEEAIRIGRESGVSVQISHHKACGRKARGRVKETLATIDEARSKGMDVWADQYPYTAISTGLGSLLPRWAFVGGTPELLVRLSSADARSKIREEMVREAENGWIADFGGWDSVVVSVVRNGTNRAYEGMSVSEIASRMGKHPADAVLDLMLAEQGGVGIVHFVIDEADVREVMRHPAVVIGSDATARAVTGMLSRGKPHPRAYGSFARVLGKYVRDEGVLTLEEAVAKMTGRTARRVSLQGRGILAEGCFADITVFDPAGIADTATYQEPHSRAAGIKYVVVNGEVVLEDGDVAPPSEIAPGRVLRLTIPS